MTTNLIRATDGDTEYLSVVLTEDTGKNISGSTFRLSLAGYDAPAAWTAPDVTEIITLAQVRLKLLTGATGTVTPTPGRYWLWVQIGDSPEVVTRRAPNCVDIG